MALHKVKKGLDLPIAGRPSQAVEAGQVISHAALLGPDYVGLKPSLKVSVGDIVRRGQVLFEDKKNPGVNFTAPAAGRVAAINRGERRSFQSLVIDLSDAERDGHPADAECVEFKTLQAPAAASAVKPEQLRALLLESGLWTAFRTRPLGKVPGAESRPHSIFVTAIDSNPLAADPAVVLKELDGFQAGLELVAKLTEGRVYICQAAGARLPVQAVGRLQVEEFAGPHPAGLPGFHIHSLDPVSRSKTVWYINYQDVCAIGQLFASGRLPVERLIALAGPSVSRPRIVRTRVGASLAELCRGEIKPGESRTISGSVFSGRTAADEFAYLGRYHLQVSVLPEQRQRELLGWLAPGMTKFSTVRAFLSGLLPGSREFAFGTSTHGSPRAMVPIGMYERVMPMDMVATYLLRSLVIGDLDSIEKLGGLELEEEDLALCTFVCPSKIEYGPILRDRLNEFDKELA